MEVVEDFIYLISGSSANNIQVVNSSTWETINLSTAGPLIMYSYVIKIV